MGVRGRYSDHRRPNVAPLSRDCNLRNDRRRNRRDETEGVPAPGHEAEWGAGVRVTIKNFVAAAELVKHDQAECFDDGGRLYIREPA